MPRPFTLTRGEIHLDGECFGEDADPAILLLAGTSCTRDWWPPALCARLAELPARVIRYDQRDTGSSSTWPVGAPGYSLRDLAEDARGILDDLGVERAHLVGFSQGGWVAQLLGIEALDRVASLTLISTRPTDHGPADPDLPEVDASLLEAWSSLSEPDWSDPLDVLDSYIAGERVVSGDDFDDAAVGEMCAAAIARSGCPRSASNHQLMAPGARWRERLGEIQAPTAVIHGTADPLFPVGNAHALAAEIPDSELHLVDGVGHELPERAWTVLIDVLDRHLHLHPREVRAR